MIQCALGIGTGGRRAQGHFTKASMIFIYMACLGKKGHRVPYVYDAGIIVQALRDVMQSEIRQ